MAPRTRDLGHKPSDLQDTRYELMVATAELFDEVLDRVNSVVWRLSGWSGSLAQVREHSG